MRRDGEARGSVTAYFNEAHIQQIQQALDIVDVVGNYVALKPKGKEMVGLCPFHDDKRPSMNVSAAKQIFKCFACGAGGDVIKFMMLREKLTFPEAVRILADRAGVNLPERQEQPGPQVDRNQLETVNRWSARYFRSLFEHETEGQIARKYLQERKITDDTARRFGLGWAPDCWDGLVQAVQAEGLRVTDFEQLGLFCKNEHGGCYDRFRNRLMFPVLDAMGRVIAFGGRTLGDDPAKYMNSQESALFDKSGALYGIHAAKDAIIKQRTAVVVEGYTDCLMAHQYGVENVVATLGTSLTAEHARMLSRYANRIVLVYDADAAGQKAADRAIEIFFRRQIEVRLVTLPKGMDPCDFLLANGAEAFTEMLAGATDALEYRWQIMSEQLEGEDSVHGRKQAVEEFILLVARACDQGNMDKMAEGLQLNNVAKLVEQPLHVVLDRVRKLQRRFRGQAATSGEQPGVRAMPETVLAGDSFVNTQREVLEVLLNKPHLFTVAREALPEPTDFADEIHQRIAQQIWQAYERNPDYTLGELMAGCTSPELCRMITDMADRGEKRGNYEATLEYAFKRIRMIQHEQAASELSEQAITAGEKYGNEAETALLYDVQARQTGLSVKQRKARPIIPK
jgi:DNA primase